MWIKRLLSVLFMLLAAASLTSIYAWSQMGRPGMATIAGISACLFTCSSVCQWALTLTRRAS